MNIPTILTTSIQHLRWGNLPGSAMALAIAETAKNQERPVVVICDTILQAQRLADECAFFTKDENLEILLFPDRETLPYDSFSPYQELTSERLACLYHLPQLKRGIVITAASTIMHRLLPQQFLVGNCFLIHTGDKLNLENFRQQLEIAGYHHVSQVMQHGEYAIRGSIIDLFPMGINAPIRIDLFDREIESIRYFNPEDQRSGEKIADLALLPAHEFPMDEAGITLFRQNWRQRFAGNPLNCPIYQNISEGIAVAGIEYFIPLFFSETASFFDYIPKNSLILKCKQVQQSLETFWKDIEYRYEQYGHDITRPLLTPTEVFFRVDETLQKINQFSFIQLHQEAITEKTGCSNFPISKSVDLQIDRKAKHPLEKLEQHLASQHDTILFCVESAGRREALLDLLKTIQLSPVTLNSWSDFIANKIPLSILVAPLQDGFILQDQFEIITENQLFGEQAYQPRKPSKYQLQADAAIRDLMELKIGDAIVHLTHGIGRYLGLQTLTVADETQEFLMIEYANDAKLYVPVSSLHMISRFGGSDADHAPLHILGTDQWNKAKQKAAERVRDVAAELLAVYAKRQLNAGFEYKNPENYQNFATAFPFEETPDQTRAIKEILTDMSSNKAMDRLVCGDVGFGKTEVAMRAAFVAVENNKQVAMLVPTTLLAQQHYQTFLDRFADWPIRIEVLSRFKTKKDTDAALQKIAEGKIDIVIGTHKLIQKDVKFANLGLLLIDEEHRFGVQQKERLKALRAEVDILTLTATPIPRTLNMSLAGIRDLSLITTPPARRLAVKTFVYEWRKEIIREGILRELQRGGQIYFLHNNVETIENTAAEIRAIVPEVKIGIAHGQMREKQLEKIMLDFYHHRINVLVCTTIVESGIDVPTANTIIMDRADKLGLAQLHQLRGRVGRSHHQAYAYLLVPSFKTITGDAVKRLEAIAAYEDLGAGFMLANHDLEIRGAGELLGEDQSGQIQAIGFTLYMELLERAVNSLKAGHVPSFDDVFQQSTEVELRIPALIPEDYLPDVHSRLMIYKRMASAKNSEGLKELQIELIDRFGLLPQALKNLFAITELRLKAERLGIQKLETSGKQGKIIFNAKPNINPAHLIKLIQIKPARYKLAGADKLNFFFDSEIKPEKLPDVVEGILEELSG